MTPRDLLERCRRAEVQIWDDGEDLVLRYAGELPPGLRQDLRTHKPALLEYLRHVRTAYIHPCACCGSVYFTEPSTLCYSCRRDRDGRPLGEPCPGCGEACEECLGHPEPETS